MAVVTSHLTRLSGNSNQSFLDSHVRVSSTHKACRRIVAMDELKNSKPEYILKKPEDHFARREHGIRLETSYSCTRIKNKDSSVLKPDDYWPEYDDMPRHCVFETKFTPSLQLWKPKPKPEPDLFVLLSDFKSDREYFVAYSSPEEDGSISPKYYVYPPSFLAKDDYKFTGCSLNGLLHFYRDDVSHVLWNPTTSEYKILPKPFVEPLVNYVENTFGLWFDHTFENYKLLHLVDCLVKRDQKGRGMSFHMDLYSNKTNSWKRIPTSQFDSCFATCGACVYGTFYSITSTGLILAFDISTETFSTLPLPNTDCDIYMFIEYKGLLAALEIYTFDTRLYYEPFNAELWIMSDGSWTRESVFHARGMWEPKMFSEDGRLLYITTEYELELAVFDRANGKLKHLGIAGCPEIKIFPFFESFVQLNGTN